MGPVPLEHAGDACFTRLSRVSIIQTVLTLMYLTTRYYAESCLPSLQIVSSQSGFFSVGPSNRFYYLFNVNAFCKSKDPTRYLVQQGSNMNNHFVYSVWVSFNGQVSVRFNQCAFFYSV